MFLEARRFDVWDDSGTLFMLVEFERFLVDDRGRTTAISRRRFETLTGMTAKPTEIAGEYYVEEIRLTLRDSKPPRSVSFGP